MKFLVTGLGVIFLCSSAHAQPTIINCDALSDVAAYPVLFQSHAPFHTDSTTGMILTQQDFIEDYTLTDEALALLKLLKTNIEQTEGMMAIVSAPSRMAPLKQLDPIDLSPPKLGYSRERAMHTFANLIEKIRGVGIYIPDMFEIIQNSSTVGEVYFLEGDNHWSPDGAFKTFEELSYQVVRDVTSIKNSDLEYIGTETLQSVGSYRRVVAEVCDVEATEISFPAPVIRKKIDDSENLTRQLFDDMTENENVFALLGTSFSNGGGNDLFRAADSMGYHLNVDVENFAIGGGSQTTSIEAYLHDDAARSRISGVVWELPHYQLNALGRSNLSQIYGAALPACISGDFTFSSEFSVVNDTWASLDMAGLSLQDVLELHIVGYETGTLLVEATYGDGGAHTYELRRNDRVPADRRPKTWRLYMADPLQPQFSGNPRSLRIRIPGLTEPVTVAATACSSVLR